MSTPIFDEVAALHPNIDITVHEEIEEIHDIQRDVLRKVVVRHELEFNYMEPLPTMKRHEGKKPWE